MQSPQGEIKLTVQTASGVTIDIDMDSEDGKLAVSVHSSGSLNETERAALASLAAGLQRAEAATSFRRRSIDHPVSRLDNPTM